MWWRKLYSFSIQLITLKTQVEKNAQDIKELRQDLDELIDTVNLLKIEIRHSREIDPREKENLILRLENNILKFKDHLRLGGKNVQDEE
jgi:regulator of replication initiation timing